MEQNLKEYKELALDQINIANLKERIERESKVKSGAETQRLQTELAITEVLQQMAHLQHEP
jgi:hypothetical protein